MADVREYPTSSGNLTYVINCTFTIPQAVLDYWGDAGLYFQYSANPYISMDISKLEFSHSYGGALQDGLPSGCMIVDDGSNNRPYPPESSSYDTVCSFHIDFRGQTLKALLEQNFDFDAEYPLADNGRVGILFSFYVV